MLLTKSTDATKFSNSNCRFNVSPSRVHPGRPERRRWMSSSLKGGMVSPVRVARLVPSATETLFALGLGESVVGVTHECDYPQAAATLPSLTRSVLPEGLSAAEIDAAVKERTQRGESIYGLDEDLLRELDPDLLVPQPVR